MLDGAQRRLDTVGKSFLNGVVSIAPIKLLSRLLGLGCGALLAVPVQAKPHKHHNNNAQPAGTPYPEAAPFVDPSALPSVSLQPFLDTHLGRVLAPLGQPGMDQPEVLTSLKQSYADGMVATPAPRKPAYLAAQRVCDALAGVVVERQKAAAALAGATSTHSSENVQPRGGRRDGQVAVANTNEFFVNAQKNDWNRKAGELRQNVMGLYQQERAIERQVTTAPVPGAATPAPAGVPVAPGGDAPTTPVPATPAVPTPSVSAPPGASR